MKTEKSHSVRSLFSSIIGLGDGRSPRKNKLGRLQLFGMGGTFGYGLIKHCDTWDVAEESSERGMFRKEVQELAAERRKEAMERLGSRENRGVYDFINR